MIEFLVGHNYIARMTILHKNFFRNLLALVAGFIVACVLMLLLKFLIILIIYSGVVDLGIKDTEGFRALLKQLDQSFTTPAYFVLTTGWAINCLVAGYAVARLSSNKYSLTWPLVLGVAFLTMGISNLLILSPHVEPNWAVVTSLLLSLVMPVVGGKLASR